MSELSSTEPRPDPDLVPAEVIDALSEALVRSGNPAGRAEIVYRLTEELCEAIAWLQASEPVVDELISLEGIRTAARYHRHRMGQRTTSAGDVR